VQRLKNKGIAKMRQHYPLKVQRFINTSSANKTEAYEAGRKWIVDFRLHQGANRQKYQLADLLADDC